MNPFPSRQAHASCHGACLFVPECLLQSDKAQASISNFCRRPLPHTLILLLPILILILILMLLSPLVTVIQIHPRGRGFNPTQPCLDFRIIYSR